MRIEWNEASEHGGSGYLAEDPRSKWHPAYKHNFDDRWDVQSTTLPADSGTSTTRKPVTELQMFEEKAYMITDDLVNLLVRKQSDYGSHNIAGAPGGAMNGLLVRMHDKLARINNLTNNKKEPNYESLHDSFSDLANYCVIAIMVLNGWWEGAKYPEYDCE